MSIKVMSLIWENSTRRRGELLLLLALADHANDEGYCKPGMTSLARKTRTSRRNVLYTIDKLIASGELEKVGTCSSDYGTNEYRITIQGLVKPTSLVKRTSRRVVKPTSPEVVKPTSHESSLETSLESLAVATIEKHTALDLTISLTQQGKEFIDVLNEHRAAIGQRPIVKYKTVEQKAAFETALSTLNGQTEKLTRAALARNITSMDRLLSWFEGCARKHDKETKPEGKKVIKL